MASAPGNDVLVAISSEAFLPGNRPMLKRHPIVPRGSADARPLLPAGRLLAAPAIAVAIAAGSCVTTTTSQPVGLERAVLTPMPVARAWTVEEDGSPIGSVLRYSQPDGPEGSFVYVVRNLWDQDLGIVDARGRAWRRIPHAEDRWIGTGTVVQGVRQILEAGNSAHLIERPPDEIEVATEAARGR